MNKNHLELKEKKRVALNSIFAAIFLTISKLIVGIMTNSLSIISEAVHSGLDLGSAFIAYFSVKVSNKPADPDHHYGHGKIEYLGAFTEAILLVFTCIWILEKSIGQIFSGKIEVESSFIGFAVMIISIVINAWRTTVLNKVAKKYDSKALKAEALHFLSDILSSIVVIIGLIFVGFGIKYADPIAALIVAILVGIASVRLCKETVDVLIDKVPAEVAKSIKDKLLEHNNILGFHKLRIRKSGKLIFVDFHIVVSKDATLIDAHRITDEIRNNIAGLGFNIDVTIHAEPRTDKEEAKKILKEKKLIAEVVKEHKDIIVNFHNLTIHKTADINAVDLHIVLPKGLSVEESHKICDHLEDDIKQIIPNMKINIHVEPCDDSCVKCGLDCTDRKENQNALG